jgi:hypothetical protein
MTRQGSWTPFSDGKPPSDESIKAFLICKTLMRGWRDTGNPVLVWWAIQKCIDLQFPFPPGIVGYLRSAAAGIMNGPTASTPPRTAARHVAEALKFKTRRGGTEWDGAQAWARDRQLARPVLGAQTRTYLSTGRLPSVAAAARDVAGKSGLTAGTVRAAFNRARARTRDSQKRNT